jgi:hypothetical protein
MEADNLKTVSVYINNQLLSRGLLRNGETIEFSRPDKGEGGIEGTMGRIISVVNDLILRRDVRFFHRVPLCVTNIGTSREMQHRGRTFPRQSVQYALMRCDKRQISNDCRQNTPRRRGSSGWQRRRNARCGSN